MRILRGQCTTAIRLVKDSEVEFLDLPAKTGGSDETYLFRGKRRGAATAYNPGPQPADAKFSIDSLSKLQNHAHFVQWFPVADAMGQLITGFCETPLYFGGWL
jgi:hypothetical protein